MRYIMRASVCVPRPLRVFPSMHRAKLNSQRSYGDWVLNQHAAGGGEGRASVSGVQQREREREKVNFNANG